MWNVLWVSVTTSRKKCKKHRNENSLYVVEMQASKRTSGDDSLLHSILLPMLHKKIAQSAIAIVNEAAYTFHTESHRFQSFSQMKKSIAKIQCTRIPTHPKKIERARECVKNGLTKRKMRTEKFAEHNGKNLVAITKTQQVDKFQFEDRRTASSSYVKAILFASHFISLVASVAAANV